MDVTYDSTGPQCNVSSHNFIKEKKVYLFVLFYDNMKAMTYAQTADVSASQS